MQQYAWLIWSSFSLIIWSLLYFSLKDKGKQREMLVFSLWISLFGLTQPLWVPEYWKPPSIFNLPLKFDVESIIFSFGTGGIAVEVYRRFFPVISASTTKHKYHLLVLCSGPVAFVFLLITTRMNHIYSAIIAMAIGGLFSYFFRPDLRKRMFVSAGLCTALYFGYFLLLVVMFPGYIERVWNLKAISGILIAGVPVEELIFAVCLGFLWPSVYEYIISILRKEK